MLFRQSAVRELTRETVTEAWDNMPEDIVAAFQGSGVLAAGFDATGMQGLNFRIGQYPDTASVTHPDMLLRDNLHLYHSDVLSRHYRQRRAAPGPQRPDWVPMPLGWIDYLIEIDGQRYDARGILEQGSDWQRKAMPREGMIETAFTIDRVRLRWQSNIAPDTSAFDFDFQAVAKRRVTVKLIVRCHQTLRDGRPLATGGLTTANATDHVLRRWSASTDTSTEMVHRPVIVSWALTCSDDADYAWTDNHIELTWQETGHRMNTGIRVVCTLDHDTECPSLEAAQLIESARSRGIAATMRQACEAWRLFAEQGLDFQIGDPEKEFLTLQQQYLLKAGQSWSNGLFSGNIWGQRFQGRTYWDAFFIADGMLRTGRVDLVRCFADWLVRTMRPSGRPHMWMTYWDGTPGTLGDMAAWFVNLNFASVQIRLYESTQNSEDLNNRAFPYLQRVAHFLLDEIVKPDAEGWTLAGQTAHDVGSGDREAAAQRGVLALTVSVLAKYAQYADLTGQDDAQVRTCKQIDAHFRRNPIDLSQPGMWDMRIPYMGDIEPFASVSSWWHYAKTYFEQLPAATYHLMPWWSASSATSLSIAGGLDLQANRGATELSLRCQDDATDFVCGLGYFNERLYEMQTGGFAPFPPAAGAWLSSVATMFGQGSTWDNTINVGVNLPKRWRYQRLTYRGVTTFNGGRIQGRYDPFEHTVKVDVNRDSTLRIRVPARIEGDFVRVSLNGRDVENYEYEADECVSFPVSAGSQDISVLRDMNRPSDVLVVEPFSHGKQLVELAEMEGHTVRWLRDYAALDKLLSDTKVIIFNVSWVATPGEIVAQLHHAARNGKAVVGMCHSGIPDQDRHFGELTGVNATPTEPWQFTETQRVYQLTDRGRRVLRGLPEPMHLPATQIYTAEPADDVQVLVTDRSTDNVPAVTRRTVGQGSVWWMAPGNQSSNRQPVGNITRRTILYGDSTANYAERNWLTNEDFQRLFRSVINAALAGAC